MRGAEIAYNLCPFRFLAELDKLPSSARQIQQMPNVSEDIIENKKRE